MLYITDIDKSSFGLSQTDASVDAVYPKLYYATSVVNYLDPETHVVTIRHTDDSSYLVTNMPIKEINLLGVVYTDKIDFVKEFNAFMNVAGGGATESSVSIVTGLGNPDWKSDIVDLENDPIIYEGYKIDDTDDLRICKLDTTTDIITRTWATGEWDDRITLDYE